MLQTLHQKSAPVSQNHELLFTAAQRCFIGWPLMRNGPGWMFFET